MVRSSNTRDVPSNMKMFPNDIATAEHLTNGNPNILEDDLFAPEEKPSYNDLFPKKTPGKKGKLDSIKEYEGWKSRKLSDSPLKNGRRSLPLPSPIQRQITHPRFITKALEGRSDHEVRIRHQRTTPQKDDSETETPSPVKKYNCHICGFGSARLNVIVLHNKSHSASFVEAQQRAAEKAKTKVRDYSTPPTVECTGTPTTVSTSRGRVKSVPKRLLDYTDEPLPKIFKEKPKEEKSPSPKRTPKEKATKVSTPKKAKEEPAEKVQIKRPLFGKRKTAKEKAEIAAKLKQENEAIKETLLKDWDDDDVNQEEAELERLKQSIEANSMEIDEDDLPGKSCSSMKPAEELNESGQSNASHKKDDKRNEKEKSCFDFDDSDDSIPVNDSIMKFGMKIPRVFTDDKFKKPRPPKPLESKYTKYSEKQSSNSVVSTTVGAKKEEDNDTADLDEAFKTMLEETTVPTLPEIPKTGLPTNTVSPIGESDPVSDISSTTDSLCENSESMLESKLCEMDYIGGREELEQIGSGLESLDQEQTIEICSTASHELNQDANDLQKIDQLSKPIGLENQKNFGISASNPSFAEIENNDVVTGTLVSDSPNTSDVSAGYEQTMSGTYETAEISSSCDVNRSCGEVEVPVFVGHELNDDNKESKNIQPATMTDPAMILPQITNVGTYNEVADISFLQKSENATSDSSVNNKSSSVSAVDSAEVVNSGFEMCPLEGSEPHSMSKYMPSFDAGKVKTEHISDFSGEAINNVSVGNTDSVQSTEIFKTNDYVTSVELLKVEDPIKVEHPIEASVLNETDKDLECGVTGESMSGSFVELQNIAESSNEVSGEPVTEFCNINSICAEQEKDTQKVIPIRIESVEPIATLEMADYKTDHTITQSIQDMELDINSMPVIIGEDFLPSEPPKPNPVPIQPKYSQSIVISPKGKKGTSVSTCKVVSKPDSVIMQVTSLGEGTSVTPNIHSEIALSGKSGKAAVKTTKSPKTTSVKTIKLQPGALSKLNVGTLQKGTNQQVLILKTAGGQQQKLALNKGMLQKIGGAQNLIQHGGKVLIVTNSQASGQGKLNLTTQQQQIFTSGGKLATGTRLITSKIVTSCATQSTPSGSKDTTAKTAPKTQKLVINKDGIICTTSKSVIINKSGLLTPISSQSIISKGQTFLTQSMLTSSKTGGIIAHNMPQTNKPTTIIASQALTSNKGMILTPMSSKGTIISGNQKLRIVSSKSAMSGTRLVMQNPQGKVALAPQQKTQHLKLVSGVKGQTAGNTILIQTSQGVLATSTNTTSSQQPLKVALPKTISSTAPTPAKVRITPAPVGTQPTTKKITVQKISRPSPNILQKTQRKTTPRATKSTGNRLLSPVVSSATDPLLLSTASTLPVIGQSALVQAQVPNSGDGALVYLTVDESGNYRPLDSKSLVSFERSTPDPRTLFIPADTRTTGVENIFLAIDDSGNIVNISQPASNASFTTESSAPSQDILAKALANTQVLQQETILPDIDVTSALSSAMPLDNTVLTSSAHYPQPSLSHSVLETSLTLNQPIMTPLEVPSSVSPNIGQIPSLSSSFITSNLLAPKQKHLLRPSMPLLTEDSLTLNQGQSESVFLLDSANNIITPATSSSQISFQLTLDNSNVIVSSGGSGSILTPTYQVMSSGILTPHTFTSASTQESTIESIKSELVGTLSPNETSQAGPGQNVTFKIITHPSEEMIGPEASQTAQHRLILREALEAPHTTIKSEDFLNTVDTAAGENCTKLLTLKAEENIADAPSNQSFDEYNVVPKLEPSMSEAVAEHLSLQSEIQEDTKICSTEAIEMKHSLKRSMDEEQTVTSSSDLEESAKRCRLDER